MRKTIILLGGGGHCKSCIDVIEQEDRFKIGGIIDIQEKIGISVLGYTVIGTDNELPALIRDRNVFLITIGQMRNPKVRIEKFNNVLQLGGKFPVIISPRAYVSSLAEIGEGTIIMHGAVVNADAKIGMNCIINTGAIIEHDAVVEDHCHISTKAIVNGGTVIKRGSFLGSNAITKEYIVVKENSFIKANSLVKKSNE